MKKEFNWEYEAYVQEFTKTLTDFNPKIQVDSEVVASYFEKKKHPEDAAKKYGQKRINAIFRRVVTIFEKDITTSGRNSAKLKREFLANHPNQCPNKILTHAENLAAFDEALNPSK